jgi:hypothetical protein
VSTSNVEIVKTYILHQKKHHQKRSFQEELKSFLEKHQVEYHEKYLWE